MSAGDFWVSASDSGGQRYAHYLADGTFVASYLNGSSAVSDVNTPPSLVHNGTSLWMTSPDVTDTHQIDPLTFLEVGSGFDLNALSAYTGSPYFVDYNSGFSGARPGVAVRDNGNIIRTCGGQVLMELDPTGAKVAEVASGDSSSLGPNGGCLSIAPGGTVLYWAHTTGGGYIATVTVKKMDVTTGAYSEIVVTNGSGSQPLWNLGAKSDGGFYLVWNEDEAGTSGIVYVTEHDAAGNTVGSAAGSGFYQAVAVDVDAHDDLILFSSDGSFFEFGKVMHGDGGYSTIAGGIAAASVTPLGFQAVGLHVERSFAAPASASHVGSRVRFRRP